MFAQVMAGVEKDIEIALTVAAMATLIGVTIGAIAGFYRGWVDSLLMRFVDLVLVLPVLAVLIVLSNKLAKESSNWLGLAIIIGLLSWTYVARLVRADFLSLRERDFVEASRALGATNRRIIVKHMLPNAVGPIIVNATLTVALEHHPRVDAVLPRARRPAARRVARAPRRPGPGLGHHRVVALRLPGRLPHHPDPLHLPHRRRPARGVRPEEEPGQGLSAEPALQVERLEVDFPTKDGVVHAVRGVDFSLAPGEVLGIVGESGSGKSVTALATMGLLPKSAQVRGSIRFDGRELLGLKEKQLTGVRGTGIAMIFQDPMTSLNPVYTIGWQIAEAILAHQDISKEAAMARAIELLAKVGIPNPAERVDNYPHEFSGGMRQRAVIAIAMANDPDVILADEPTTALDVTVQAQVLDSLKTAHGGDRRRAAADHPRPRGHRRPGRPRAGHVRRARPSRSERPRTSSTGPPCPTRSACSARCPGSTATARSGCARSRAPRPPCSATAPAARSRRAARWPPTSAARPSPSSRSCPSVTSALGEHRAACHFAEAVGRGDHGQVFSDGVVDNVIA